MITVLPESNEYILGFELTGKVSLQAQQNCIDKIENVCQQYGEINVLVALNEAANWGNNAGIEDLKWLVTHMKNINKIAIVCSNSVWTWLISLDKFFTPLVGIGEKHFNSEAIDDAWIWINQN